MLDPDSNAPFLRAPVSAEVGEDGQLVFTIAIEEAEPERVVLPPVTYPDSPFVDDEDVQRILRRM